MSRKKRHIKKKITKTYTNRNLPGYDININAFGEIQSTYDIDDVNTFLNENLEDKKLHNKVKSKIDKASEKKKDNSKKG